MNKHIPQLFVIIVVGYLLFLIRPALLGQLGGTFKAHTVPQEYIALENYLLKETLFSRTMWIPSVQRYGYYSPIHPAVGGYDFYHVASISGVLDNLQQFNAENTLQARSIKYVIVPYDADGEIFLKDRRYDQTLYKKTLEVIQHIPWLHEVSGFGRIHIFALQNVKDHFWIANNTKTNITYKVISPTQYQVTVKNATKGNILVFAESYDKNWQLTVGKQVFPSISFEKENALNSWILPKNGDYTLTIYYTPQKWVNIGLWISGITFFVLVAYFFGNLFYTKRHA